MDKILAFFRAERAEACGGWAEARAVRAETLSGAAARARSTKTGVVATSRADYADACRALAGEIRFATHVRVSALGWPKHGRVGERPP